MRGSGVVAISSARAALLATSVLAAACTTMLDLGDFAATDLEGLPDGAAAPDARPIADSGSGAERDSAASARDAAARDAVADAAPCDHAVAPEDCTNGVDDDCNGLVDCADPACGSFACAPPVPSGWFGPVALWEAATGAATPACPPLYDPLVDGRAGLTGAEATCTCACAPSGQVCSVMGTFHPDQTCADDACALVTPSPDGACTALQRNGCGSGGSFDLASMPVPSGGRCDPTVASTVPPSDWAIAGRVCFYSGAVDRPGGCAGGAVCMPRPASPYGGTLCVYSSADPAPASCPAGYDANPPVVLYSGMSDSRGCGPCTCSAPSGGRCTGSVRLFADSACAETSASATYMLGTSCQNYTGVDVDRGAVRGDFVVTEGSCSVVAPPAPVGEATPTLPTTVCCM